MEKHLTEGELRAALDGELDAASLRHLESCAGCQERQKQMETQNLHTTHLLGFLAPGDEPVPSSHAAWNRFSEEYLIKKEHSMFKRWFSIPLVRFGTAALLILALVLALPGSRAMAGELLTCSASSRSQWCPWTSPASSS